MRLSRVSHLIYLIFLCVACANDEQQTQQLIEETKRYYQQGDRQQARKNLAKLVNEQTASAALYFQLAEQLVQLNDVAEAANYYQKAVSLEPHHVQARLKLANILLQAGKLELASQLANEAFAQAPDDVEVLILQGKLLAAQNNTDAAFSKAETALQKKPNDANALLLLAGLMLKTGKTEQAISLLSSGITQNPDYPALRQLLASIYLQQQRLEQAKTVLTELIRIQPKELAPRKELAAVLLAAHQAAEAESVLRQAVTDLPDSESAKLLLIEFLAAKQTPEVAIAELLPMLDAPTGLYELRFKLAELYVLQNKLKDAEETLKEIVATDTGWSAAKARYRLAKIYLSERQLADAKTLLDELTKTSTEDTSLATTLKAEIALAEHKTTEAISHLRSVLLVQPNNIAVLKLLSAAHLLANDKVLAKENLEKIVALNPSDETARLDLVNLLLQTGDSQNAVQQLNALFKLNPSSKKGLQTLFQLYIAQQQWSQAQAIAIKLQQLYPHEALGFYLAGLAEQGLGKLEQSNSQFEQALRRQEQSVEPLAQLIKNYLSLKQTDKAVTKLKELIKQQSQHFYAYNLLGQVYQLSNKAPEALSAFEQALKIKQNWAEPYRHIAAIQLAQKQRESAKQTLSEGIANASEPWELVNELVALYEQERDYDKAQRLLAELQQKYPDSLALLNRYVSYAVNHTAASELLTQLKQQAQPLTSVQNSEYLDTLGWLAFKLKDYDSAKKQLTQALTLAPKQTLSQYHLGMTYHELGEQGLAQQWLQQAVAVKQDFPGKSDAIALLKQLKQH